MPQKQDKEKVKDIEKNIKEIKEKQEKEHIAPPNAPSVDRQQGPEKIVVKGSRQVISSGGRVVELTDLEVIKAKAHVPERGKGNDE